MSLLFDRITSFGVLAREDARIAEALARRFGVGTGPTLDDDHALALLALALALRGPLHGHVCLTLDDPLGSLRELPEDVRAALVWPGAARAKEALLASGLAGRADDARPRPLVIDGDTLYLARHHRDELAVAAFVRARADDFEHLDDLELARARATLDHLFASTTLVQAEAQKRAVATALLRRFAIVTGGPGTGKTTTVVRLLALLVDRARSRSDAPLRIGLVAPTGKAAARLAESVRAQRVQLPAALQEGIPTEATTIHRALGASLDGRSFRHDARARLPLDVLVVDEASMVDLPLMARLFAAVPDDARVVLLGDRDQLTSVEAGAVLADLTSTPGADQGLSAPFAEALAALVDVPATRIDATRARTDLRDGVVALETSHRFDPTRGIGRLAAAIHAGDVEAALETLATSEEARLHAPDPEEVLPAALRADVLAHAKHLVETADDVDALAALDHLRVLCALRRGPSGVEAMNQRILRALEATGRVDRRAGAHAGMPLIITRNDAVIGLFNGDIGVVRTEGEALRALFHGPTREKPRALALARLPPWEPVYAMTVHKSQGSEVDEVVLVLPDRPSPVLTRELLYTGVTRARRRVHVVGTKEVVARAIRERVVRATGLRERV